MFEPVCQVCGDSYHGHGEIVITHDAFGKKLRKPVEIAADPGPDDHDHLAVLEWPSCHVCGRVLTEEDHTDEAGTDGTISWDQYYHSPDGLEELAGVVAWFEFEAVRVKDESVERLQAIINDAVNEALRARGL